MSSEMIRKLRSALERRKPLFQAAKTAGTDCFRLFSGEGEGIEGLVVEELGDVLILQVHEGKCRLSPAEIQEAAEWYLEVRGVKSVYSKIFVADRSQQTANSDYYSESPLAGETAPEVIQVRENGWKFWVHPHDGYSTGLFLDQRENRKFLAGRAAGKTVLNLFAYTCGFSVGCAAVGGRVTSVDLSEKYLDWGKRNFILNEIGSATQEFVPMDALSFLKRCQKQGRVFDLIITDPPSFSRSKSTGIFSLKKDLKKLIAAMLEVSAPGGELFFSCNFSQWTSTSLRDAIEKSLDADLKWSKLPPAPLDFKAEMNPLSQVLFHRG